MRCSFLRQRHKKAFPSLERDSNSGLGGLDVGGVKLDSSGVRAGPPSGLPLNILKRWVRLVGRGVSVLDEVG